MDDDSAPYFMSKNFEVEETQEVNNDDDKQKSPEPCLIEMTDEADMTSGSILEVVVPVASHIEKNSFHALQHQIDMKKQQLQTKFITESSEF
jgi:hypothetical protein